MSGARKHGIGTTLLSLLVRDPLIYLYTVVLGTVSLLSSLFDYSGRIQHSIARLWSRLILSTSSCPLRVQGLEKIDTTRPHIYAVNHLSALDIPALYCGLPFQFRIMAKRELFRLPFVGWHLKRSGQIPIERTDARSSLRSLTAASTAVRNGMPLVVFPEGGRSPDGQIKPFLGGAFYVAIKAGVEVIPMALVGTYEALPMNTYIIRPEQFRLFVGEPISTEGLAPRDMDQLAGRVQQAIEDLYYPNAHVGRPSAVDAVASARPLAE